MMADTLHATAARLPDKPALRVASGGRVRRTITYGELDLTARRGAGALAALGLEPGGAHRPDLGAGDRVGVLCPNGAAFAEALYAVWAAGLVAVPLNTTSVAREVAAALGDADARAVVVHRDLRAVVDEVRDQLPGLAHVLVVDDDTALAEAAGLGDAAAPDAPAAVDAEQLALIAYTAGTTGRAKGAMLRHRNLTANHRQLAATKLELAEGDRVLCVLPLFHIYALNVALAFSLARGATVVVADRFDPMATLQLVADERVSVLVGAPPMYGLWAQAEHVDDIDVASVRFAVSGAAPLPPPVLARFHERFGVPVYEGYGLTESAPVLTSTAVTGRMRPGSVGQPLPEVELRLVGEDGRPVRRGDPGEVLARGPNVFAGYWRNPTETAQALVDGWLATGDIGYEQDGALHLVDRKRDLVIVSGFNVYPREVEEVLAAHPGVAAAAVVGVPDPTTGEAVTAYVQPLPGAAPTADELRAHCRAQLARFKVPAQIEIVETLPVGPAGKVLRRMLREDR